MTCVRLYGYRTEPEDDEFFMTVRPVLDIFPWVELSTSVLPPSSSFLPPSRKFSISQRGRELDLH